MYICTGMCTTLHSLPTCDLSFLDPVPLVSMETPLASWLLIITIHCTNCNIRAVTICILWPLDNLDRVFSRSINYLFMIIKYLKFLRFLLVVGSRAKEANMSSNIRSRCFSYCENIYQTKINKSYDVHVHIYTLQFNIYMYVHVCTSMYMYMYIHMYMAVYVHVHSIV